MASRVEWGRRWGLMEGGVAGRVGQGGAGWGCGGGRVLWGIENRKNGREKNMIVSVARIL